MLAMKFRNENMKEDFYFESCGSGRIHAKIWNCDGAPKGVIQIVHGIAEHVCRYDDFANFLVDHCYVVVAEDHMGHGESCGKNDVRGFFHGGWSAAIKDTVKLLEITKSRFGDIPYILFGHSMGSFMVRTILADYTSLGISGCIICGTGWQSSTLLSVAIPVAKAISKFFGEQRPSKILHTMAFGAYNNHIEQRRTPNDWLSRDNKIVDQYEADPNCGFIPTAGLMRDMLCGIQYIQRDSTLKRMDIAMPCYFISGAEDPVGDYGAAVQRAVHAFKNTGMKNVTCKIYPLCRHEILNEINRQEVYEDTLAWIDNLI